MKAMPLVRALVGGDRFSVRARPAGDLQVQNTEKVTLHFLVWNFTWPLGLFTLVTAIFGALVWFGLGVMRPHPRRVARREYRDSSPSPPDR